MQTPNPGYSRIDSSRLQKKACSDWLKSGRPVFLIKRIHVYKKLCAVVICIAFVWPSQSQNLVPNPGFELANCPTNYNGLPTQVALYMQDWYSANCSSPDPMAACSNYANTSPPGVWFGYQYAHTGNNYMGVSFYSGWYEYIGVQLSSPLVAGDIYDVSFWVSCADQVRYASDALGIYFSNTQIICTSGFSGPTFTYTPQVVQTPGVFLTDSTNWRKVSGTYSAAGGEQYIVLGCFKAWNTATLYDFGTGNTRCYYYIDDVSIQKTGSLPIDLFSFEANPDKNDHIQVDWETSNEKNSCSFELERSPDAINFTTISTSKASGNSKSIVSYDYTDIHPLSGINYYRLKHTDCDGKFSYSKITSVKINFLEIKIYPNPLHDQLFISLEADEDAFVKVRIFDVIGRLVYEKFFYKEHEIEIPFNQYPKGVYALTVNTENHNLIYRKIIKQ